MAALVIARLIRHGRKPVLAVDADPNSCLDAGLGVAVTKSVGEAREESRVIASRGMAAGVAKRELIEMKVAEALVEAAGFDLIAMGRPEEPGCYCYANNVVREILSTLSQGYPWVVLDNEAGLENLSRRIVHRADYMLLVADSSRRGIETAVRLQRLARDMGITWGALALVINRAADASPGGFARETAGLLGTDRLVVLPHDGEVARRSEEGASLLDLPDDNPTAAGIDGLLTALGILPDVR